MSVEEFVNREIDRRIALSEAEAEREGVKRISVPIDCEVHQNLVKMARAQSMSVAAFASLLLEGGVDEAMAVFEKRGIALEVSLEYAGKVGS